MWISRRWWWGVATMAVVAGVAWACGPDFPNQLLDDRAATLKATPVNSFAYEVAHLRKAGDALKAKEASPWESYGEPDKASPLDGDLDEAQLAQRRQMADADSGDQAYELGKGLPEAVRLYAAAAVDIHRADGDPQRLLAAEKRLHALLDLPEEQARPRAVAAAYMLGEINLELFIDCVNCKPDDREGEIRGDFMQVRELARKGAPDQDGLAVASYGEEARLYLRGSADVGDDSAAGNFCRWEGFIAGGECGATIPVPQYVQAMGLYAEQAARGSVSGVDSLRHLAGYAFGHPDLLAGLLDDPLAQQVMVAYALAYSRDETADDDDYLGPPAVNASRLASLADAIQRRGLDHVEGADRLAALAYRGGRYELAATLAGKQPGALSSWVEAKLALRKGDMDAAAAAYDKAIQAFPRIEPGAEPPDAGIDLLQGERGVLSLARGEYVQALAQIWPAADTWWGDVAYLAERVLTTDELKQFVDAHAPKDEASPADGGSFFSGGVSRGTALRELLARRLMREGRYDEAIPYFRDPSVVHAVDGEGEALPLREWARQYADALARSQSGADIDKAEALYEAAVLERGHGMEILGYEAAPDYYALGGEFPGGMGQVSAETGTLLTAGEHDRFVASAPKPSSRFHYRYTAADRANHAADLLPARSQAFAAVLCNATGWMMDGPPDYDDPAFTWDDSAAKQPTESERHVQALYRRYVQQGPYVPWAADFGHDCPAPDFDRARSQLRQQRIAHVRHVIGRYRWLLLGAGVLVLVGLVALFRRRRS